MSTLGVVRLNERLARRDPRRAAIMMAVLNAVAAVAVINHYRLGGR